MIAAEFFPKTESYRPKGGWCKKCIKSVGDCGSSGTLRVVRITWQGKVHITSLYGEYAYCGRRVGAFR